MHSCWMHAFLSDIWVAQEAVRVRDREVRRLGAEVARGASVDGQAAHFRAEAHEGIIVQLSQQVRGCRMRSL